MITLLSVPDELLLDIAKQVCSKSTASGVPRNLFTINPTNLLHFLLVNRNVSMLLVPILWENLIIRDPETARLALDSLNHFPHFRGFTKSLVVKQLHRASDVDDSVLFILLTLDALHQKLSLGPITKLPALLADSPESKGSWTLKEIEISEYAVRDLEVNGVPLVGLESLSINALNVMWKSTMWQGFGVLKELGIKVPRRDDVEDNTYVGRLIRHYLPSLSMLEIIGDVVRPPVFYEVIVSNLIRDLIEVSTLSLWDTFNVAVLTTPLLIYYRSLKALQRQTRRRAFQCRL